VAKTDSLRLVLDTLNFMAKTTRLFSGEVKTKEVIDWSSSCSSMVNHIVMGIDKTKFIKLGRVAGFLGSVFEIVSSGISFKSAVVRGRVDLVGLERLGLELGRIGPGAAESTPTLEQIELLPVN
jgi:hypothetical protein